MDMFFRPKKHTYSDGIQLYQNSSYYSWIVLNPIAHYNIYGEGSEAYDV